MTTLLKRTPPRRTSGFLYELGWVGAEAELKKSIDLNPSFMYARNVYAQLLGRKSGSTRCSSFLRRACGWIPVAGRARNHGMLLYYKRDYCRGRAGDRRALNMEPGNDPRCCF